MDNGYEVNTFYEMVVLDYNNNYPTHSFLTYKDNNKYYHKEIKVDKITREENKNIVIEEIITMLINIIN